MVGTEAPCQAVCLQWEGRLNGGTRIPAALPPSTGLSITYSEIQDTEALWMALLEAN